MLKYYVYAYLREDGSPYYIGKGTGNRAWHKGEGEVPKPTHNSRIIIVESLLTLTGALAIERRLIRWWGRKDLGTGILRNKTNGGDGGTGAKLGSKLSSDTKKKISKASVGRKRGPMSEESKKKLSESLRGKNVGKCRTVEQKNAQSIRQIGIVRKPLTDITKQKISNSLKGRQKGPMNEELRQKISLSLVGKSRTSEHSQKISTALQGRTQGIMERKNYLLAMETGKTKCEHCGKINTKGNYIRWHGNNCKDRLTGETPYDK